MIRTLRFLSLSGLLGGFVGYLLGLWYCIRRHSVLPGAVFSLADEVYYVSTALLGVVFGLIVGGVRLWIIRRH